MKTKDFFKRVVLRGFKKLSGVRRWELASDLWDTAKQIRKMGMAYEAKRFA